MATRSRINVKIKEDITLVYIDGKNIVDLKKGDYVSVYCHWDGYVDGVGKTLVEKYNSYELALDLIKHGDLSALLDELISYYGWRQEEIIPCVSKEPEKEEYTYVFDDGEWYVRSWKDEGYAKVINVL